MVKIILFDFWGTLVEQGVWSPIKQVSNILKINLAFSDFVVRMETAMMTQKFSELKGAFNALGEEFNMDITKQEMDSLIGMWNKSWMLAEPYPDTLPAMVELKKKYKLILVSNADPFSVERVLDKHDLSKYFDDIFLSYKEGCIKTDPLFLQNVLKKMGLEPKDCVMVGDSLQSDIKAAENAGIKAFLIDRKNRREYENKISSLNELKQKLGDE